MRTVNRLIIVALMFVPAIAPAACGCEAPANRPCDEATLTTATQTDEGMSFSLCADCGDDEWAGAIVPALVLLPFVIAVHRAMKRRNPLLIANLQRCSG